MAGGGRPRLPGRVHGRRIVRIQFRRLRDPHVHAARRRSSLRSPTAARAGGRGGMTLSPPRARALLQAMRGGRVLVLGDAMLDPFLWGKAARLSPEAPVPVVEIASETFHLGGAANVAGNVRALGGQAVVAGGIGDDGAGLRLRAALVEG